MSCSEAWANAPRSCALALALLVGCHGAEPVDGSGSADRDSGTPAASNQLTEVTLRGPAARIAEVTATSLERVQTTSVADGTVRVLFRSVAGTDWASTFLFVWPPGPATFSLRPWLCPRVRNAVSATLDGGLATEQRLLDIDHKGRF